MLQAARSPSRYRLPMGLIPKPVVALIKQIAAWAASVPRTISTLVLSSWHGRELCCLQDNTDKIDATDILVFCVLRNESHRLPFFLRHYRALGVNHFVFVDNGSTDGFCEQVVSDSDVTIYFTRASYKKAKFGALWLNSLLRKHGSGHWCLTVDADEMLIFPGWEQQGLPPLTRKLDAQGRNSFFATMVDLYGRGNLLSARYLPGMSPLDVTPYFDQTGYQRSENWKLNTMFVRGGVRRRMLCSSSRIPSPPLNKVPLVRWRWYYSYYASTHVALPISLNGAYRHDVTGAILHWKFISQMVAKVIEEQERRQHAGSKLLYTAYSAHIQNGDSYIPGISVPYRSCEQLVELGLMRDAAPL